MLALKLPQRAYTHDFSVFYASAIAFREHVNPYTANLMPIGERLGLHVGSLIHSVDTPTALLFFIPFSIATPAVAHAIWLVVNGVALVAALILLLRPKYSGLPIRMAFGLAALAMLYAPITDNFAFGQRQTLVLLMLVLVMHQLERGREASAGLLFGLAVAYRVFPVLMAFYFVIRRQWRPLIFTGAGLAIVGSVTIAALGIPICLSYLNGIQFAMTTFRFEPADVALRGFIIRLFSYVVGRDPSSRLQFFQRSTIAVAQIVVLTLAAWPTYQRRLRLGFDRRAYGLWVTAAILLSPLSWIHYMILLLIPFGEIAVTAERQQCNRREVWAVIVSYALIAMTYRLREDLVSATWWTHGVRYLAEGSSVALLLGFLAAYWFATDTADTADANELGQTAGVLANAR